MNFTAECKKCGGATRLVGIEPHHNLDGTDVWTTECTRCRHVDVEMRAVQMSAVAATAPGSRPLN